MGKNNQLKQLIIAAELAAVMGVLSQLIIPLGPIPLTLQTIFIGLLASLRPIVEGIKTVGIYLLLGLIGIPVFAGFHSGLLSLIGPTGGYLFGFLIYVIVTGLFLKWCGNGRWQLYVANLLGASVQLLLGAAWLMIYQQTTIQQAFLIGVLPFILVGILKVIFVCELAHYLIRRYEIKAL
ncbi:biotin transporter BioY [Dellaglioa carnosa]|uniref:biotin transporter BioY n=1 Tax=Dellaglioa carnosa TaxID=2995136 RepID=UPI0022A8C34D|nr:biotin transporter BioY [Dellaglioa carnosa]MCZ2493385.1 biotin transporter BioY [Dellaglioa carnosa]